MDTNQLNDALDRLFLDEGERIVFWNDPEGEFEYQIPFLKIEGVEILDLRKRSGLETKMLLEKERPNDKFLLYSPTEEPELDQDWLLDIRYYSRAFRADRASIILDQLGLRNHHLREHLNKRRKFFDNKERFQRLKSLVEPDDKEADLDLKMLTVVTKADLPEFFNVVLSLFDAMAEEGEVDIEEPSETWKQIEKLELDQTFWEMVAKTFKYEAKNPSLGNFLIRLLATDLGATLKGETPRSLSPLQLDAAGKANAVVLMGRWRDSSARAVAYDILSNIVADEIDVENAIATKDLGDLIDVWTFSEIEKAICQRLKEQVLTTAEVIDSAEIAEVAKKRQAGHWVSSNVSGADRIPRKALEALYSALVHAAEFFDLKNRYRDGFDFEDAVSAYQEYEETLFRFDQLYRQFIETSDIVEDQGWDILKDLREEIEAAYVNWFLLKLSLAWGKFVGPKFLENWKLTKVPNQQNFYRDNVEKRLKEAENRKVFVIVSDAFRYEAAEELTRILNGRYRYQAELGSQLGVLPSYTRLGMASLLPHKQIDYNDKCEVLVDGKPTSGLDQRNEVLSAHKGMAIRADDLREMRKEDGRSLIADKKVIYIYHDRIDATGDDRKSEGETFEAVRKAIHEIADTVKYVINSLNGTYVLVTADHGFLFTKSQPVETDKSKLKEQPKGTIVAKKRYLIGMNLGETDEAWHGNTAQTAGTSESMEFWIPRGAGRFHFIGGARFIHGGAMPQEIVVPVVTVRQIKGKEVQKTKTAKVKVSVLGTNHRITSPRHRFELLQMEPISNRVKPVTLKVAIFEGSEPVTNVAKVTFSSKSEKLEDRKQEVVLVLQSNREYSRKTQYRLVLRRDDDTEIEHQSVDVIIDRAFTDDF